MLVQTLARRRNDILLGRWKSGPLIDRFTGMLGEVNVGESAEEAACRVSTQLSGVQLQKHKLDCRATFLFTEVDGTATEEKQFLYEVSKHEEWIIFETDLYAPQWIPISEIPYNQMPEDDAIWYPPFFGGHRLSGEFHFNGRTLQSYKIHKFI